MGDLSKYGVKEMSLTGSRWLDEIPDREIFAEAQRREDLARQCLCTYCEKFHEVCSCRMKHVTNMIREVSLERPDAPEKGSMLLYYNEPAEGRRLANAEDPN